MKEEEEEEAPKSRSRVNLLSLAHQQSISPGSTPQTVACPKRSSMLQPGYLGAFISKQPLSKHRLRVLHATLIKIKWFVRVL